MGIKSGFGGIEKKKKTAPDDTICGAINGLFWIGIGKSRMATTALDRIGDIGSCPTLS